jgi:hypothetical protein
MQRDWDLIRKIMIAIEELGDTQSHVEGDAIDGIDAERVSYHISLLIEADLVKGFCVKGIDGPLRCAASSLTWEGHEFLDKVRSSGMWNKIKAVAREKGLSLSVDVIKVVASSAITSLLKGV